MDVSATAASVVSARRRLAHATSAERREATSLIAAAVDAARPALSAAPMVYAMERYFAGDHHPELVEWDRAILIEDRSGYQGRGRGHSFSGVELFVSVDGSLWEARTRGSYSGLGLDGEEIEYVARTFRRIGAREVARRYGGLRVVERLCAALDRLSRETTRDAAQRETSAATAARITAALRG